MPADNINHPSHYTQGKVECIDALEAATEGLTGIEAVCTANAIKYLWRWKHKNGTEDLKKAKWYIDRLITIKVEDVERKIIADGHYQIHTIRGDSWDDNSTACLPNRKETES